MFYWQNINFSLLYSFFIYKYLMYTYTKFVELYNKVTTTGSFDHNDFTAEELQLIFKALNVLYDAKEEFLHGALVYFKDHFSEYKVGVLPHYLEIFISNFGFIGSTLVEGKHTAIEEALEIATKELQEVSDAEEHCNFRNHLIKYIQAYNAIADITNIARQNEETQDLCVYALQQMHILQQWFPYEIQERLEYFAGQVAIQSTSEREVDEIFARIAFDDIWTCAETLLPHEFNESMSIIDRPPHIHESLIEITSFEDYRTFFDKSLRKKLVTAEDEIKALCCTGSSELREATREQLVDVFLKVNITKDELSYQSLSQFFICQMRYITLFQELYFASEANPQELQKSHLVHQKIREYAGIEEGAQSYDIERKLDDAKLGTSKFAEIILQSEVDVNSVFFKSLCHRYGDEINEYRHRWSGKILIEYLPELLLCPEILPECIKLEDEIGETFVGSRLLNPYASPAHCDSITYMYCASVITKYGFQKNQLVINIVCARVSNQDELKQEVRTVLSSESELLTNYSLIEDLHTSLYNIFNVDHFTQILKKHSVEQLKHDDQIAVAFSRIAGCSLDEINCSLQHADAEVRLTGAEAYM